MPRVWLNVKPEAVPSNPWGLPADPLEPLEPPAAAFPPESLDEQLVPSASKQADAQTPISLIALGYR
jgi:hypothetical protein